jgi:anti-sigma regulatory factor (Ser/Thr protein kinase)
MPVNERPTQISYLLRGKIEEISELARYVNRISDKFGLCSHISTQINLILEELYTNTVHHGLHMCTKPIVVIEFCLKRGMLEIIYRDNGVAFNPLALKQPDLGLNLEDRPVGGLGIHLVKTITDQANYERHGNYNVITLHLRTQ